MWLSSFFKNIGWKQCFFFFPLWILGIFVVRIDLIGKELFLGSHFHSIALYVCLYASTIMFSLLLLCGIFPALFFLRIGLFKFFCVSIWTKFFFYFCKKNNWVLYRNCTDSIDHFEQWCTDGRSNNNKSSNPLTWVLFPFAYSFISLITGLQFSMYKYFTSFKFIIKYFILFNAIVKIFFLVFYSDSTSL